MKTIRIHYLQHVSFEGPGYIKTWAKTRKYSLTVTQFFEDYTLPELNEFDWLIVMGGPMGVNDDEQFPWLKAEKEFIKQAINKNKTVIGICLGSQLIANVLETKVFPNKKKEIGWFPVSLTETGKNEELTEHLPTEMMVFHWHGDTYHLPQNAKHLMQSEICTNQAFLFKENVLGLQFHLETTPDSLKRLVENCRDELVDDDFIQTETHILNQVSYCTDANKTLSKILDKLVDKLQNKSSVF